MAVCDERQVFTQHIYICLWCTYMYTYIYILNLKIGVYGIVYVRVYTYICMYEQPKGIRWIHMYNIMYVYISIHMYVCPSRNGRL